jgi:hypothetical protein
MLDAKRRYKGMALEPRGTGFVQADVDNESV